MFEKELEGIGLTKGEIKVYLTLLKTGLTTTGKIIKHSKLSSGKIYEILDKLIDKGLVTYIIKDKTKHFQATTPKKILEYVEEKKNNIEKKKKQVEKILPRLEGLHKLEKKPYSAVIYKGVQGFKTAIFETLDSMTKKDEWLGFSASAIRSKAVLRIWNQLNKKRIKKKIHTKLIITDIHTYKVYKSSRHIMEMRLLKGTGLAATVVAGNIVLIFNWEDLSIIKITNENIANHYREYFYSIWDLCKKIK